MYKLANFLGFVAILLGCILGPPIVALACIAWLPLALIWALASAIWVGDARARGGLRRKAANGNDAGFDARPRTARPDDTEEDEPDEDGSSDAREGIRIGWPSHPDPDVAIPSYYFGPIVDDLLGAVDTTLSVFSAVQKSFKRLSDLGSDANAPFFNVVVPFSVSVGLPIGLALGIVVTAAVVLIYIIICAISLVVALCISFFLRGLDSVSCFIAGIARTCWTCGENVLPCPHYLCPACERLHRDIRPGSYGVVCRICVCGRRLPTMLLTGAAKLQGVCPKCNAYLPRMFGRAAEIVVPIFGAQNVGKTRLMYMMILALKEWVYDQHGKVIYIGDAGERLDAIEDALRTSQHTEKTLPGPPRGLGLHIKFGLNNRLVYFFDAAGEMYTTHERLPELKYLNKAKTYVFVADPFSSKGVWSQLSDGEQDRLKRFRTPPGEVDKSFEATTNHMLKIAERKRWRDTRSYLAFVISKLDLLQSAGVDLGGAMNGTEGWVRKEAGLDLGDISRGARHSFGDVKYFCTAALEADGRADDSVEELLSWIFNRVGVQMGT
jgi:hypothetical protein